jgi:hypothetical protein
MVEEDFFWGSETLHIRLLTRTWNAFYSLHRTRANWLPEMEDGRERLFLGSQTLHIRLLTRTWNAFYSLQQNGAPVYQEWSRKLVLFGGWGWGSSLDTAYYTADTDVKHFLQLTTKCCTCLPEMVKKVFVWEWGWGGVGEGCLVYTLHIKPLTRTETLFTAYT